ncbi:unnamed protein product, partial [Allacma fusca]
PVLNKSCCHHGTYFIVADYTMSSNSNKPAIRKSQVEVEEGIPHKYAADYALIDGVLYKASYKESGRLWLLCVPKVFQYRFFKQIHESDLGHQGYHKTLQIIKSRFTWPKLDQTVRRFLKHCQTCLFHNNNYEVTRGYQPVIPPVTPFKRIAIDFIGEFKRTQRNKKAALTIVDESTRCQEAYPTKDMSMASAIHGLRIDGILPVAEEVHEDKFEVLKNQIDARWQANENTFRYQLIQKLKADRCKIVTSFEVGDLVLQRSFYRKPGTTAKFLGIPIFPNRPKLASQDLNAQLPSINSELSDRLKLAISERLRQHEGNSDINHQHIHDVSGSEASSILADIANLFLHDSNVAIANASEVAVSSSIYSQNSVSFSLFNVHNSLTFQQAETLGSSGGTFHSPESRASVGTPPSSSVSTLVPFNSLASVAVIVEPDSPQVLPQHDSPDFSSSSRNEVVIPSLIPQVGANVETSTQSSRSRSASVESAPETKYTKSGRIMDELESAGIGSHKSVRYGFSLPYIRNGELRSDVQLIHSLSELYVAKPLPNFKILRVSDPTKVQDLSRTYNPFGPMIAPQLVKSTGLMVTATEREAPTPYNRNCITFPAVGS